MWLGRVFCHIFASLDLLFFFKNKTIQTKKIASMPFLRESHFPFFLFCQFFGPRNSISYTLLAFADRMFFHFYEFSNNFTTQQVPVLGTWQISLGWVFTWASLLLIRAPFLPTRFMRPAVGLVANVSKAGGFHLFAR